MSNLNTSQQSNENEAVIHLETEIVQIDQQDILNDHIDKDNKQVPEPNSSPLLTTVHSNGLTFQLNDLHIDQR